MTRSGVQRGGVVETLVCWSADRLLPIGIQAVQTLGTRFKHKNMTSSIAFVGGLCVSSCRGLPGPEVPTNFADEFVQARPFDFHYLSTTSESYSMALLYKMGLLRRLSKA